MSRPLRVLLLTYHVTEESGGPGVAAAGFARGLAAKGAEVTALALNGPGRWLIDQTSAARDGYVLCRTGAGSLPRKVLALLREIHRMSRTGGFDVIWVNGIWGAQSVAGALWSRWSGVPLVIRPAGSLGTAALGRKTLKKRLYFAAVESRICARAVAVHCMTDREAEELPDHLKSKAFIVPSGVDIPVESERPPENIVGVLARIHPIKNHLAALTAFDQLVQRGHDLRMEFAGSVSDARYADLLVQRVASSPQLKDRVTFLAHVERSLLAALLSRWRVALLLSDQENLGHAVITAAAFGVPTVVSPGVGLGPALVAAGAGRVTPVQEAADALETLLVEPLDRVRGRCRAFAKMFDWPSMSERLLRHLEFATGRARL